MYLLDTVVVSATRLPDRNRAVLEWLRTKAPDRLWISVFTIGEIQQGIERAPETPLRSTLQEWLEGLRATFEGRTLPFLSEEAKTWGTLVAPFQLAGRPTTLVDSMIAATARVHGLSVVTRNVKDFESFGVPVINPWDDENGA